MHLHNTYIFLCKLIVFISIFKYSETMIFRRLHAFELSQFLIFFSLQRPAAFIGLWPVPYRPGVLWCHIFHYLILSTQESLRSLALLRLLRTLSQFQLL